MPSVPRAHLDAAAGVRPSPAAAFAEPKGAWAASDAVAKVEAAAARDGRTPTGSSSAMASSPVQSCKFRGPVRYSIKNVNMNTDNQSIFRADALKHHFGAQPKAAAPSGASSSLIMWLWAALALSCAGGLVVGLFLMRVLS